MRSSRTVARLLCLAVLTAAAACASTDDDENLGVLTYLHNAQAYAEGGHYDQALVQFRRVLQIDPANDKARLGEATCLYWMGTSETREGGRRILEAEEKFAAIDPRDYGENAWKVHLGSGMVHARLADLWGRKEDRARLAAEEGDAAAELQAAEARGQRQRQDALATEAFEAVLAAEDQPLARNNLTALFFLASRAALDAGDEEGYRRALGYFERYILEVGRSRDLWQEMKKREPELAEVYESKLRSALGQEADLRDLMANVLFKLRDHEGSIRELDRVLEIDPWRAAAFFNRGRNQEELGRFGLAADDYRRFLKATDLPPDSGQVVEAAERMQKCERIVRERLER